MIYQEENVTIQVHKYDPLCKTVAPYRLKNGMALFLIKNNNFQFQHDTEHKKYH